MDKGHGKRINTKSTRGKWVEIDKTMESADTIKVQRNLNQMREVFMNSQILRHRGDKVFFSMRNAHEW